MTISVWADVGGTFTDCFVVCDGIRQATKVLSSALVYANVQQVQSDRSFVVDDLWGQSVQSFWVGADAMMVGRDGRVGATAKITSHRGLVIELDRPMNGRVGDRIQLDPGIQSPVLATRGLLGIPLTDRLPPMDVRLGTTRGTNALLTRQGAKTALVITKGFGDLLWIGQQNRPDLFAMDIVKPTPLTETVVEIDERLDCDGNVLRVLDRDRVRDQLRQLYDQGIQSLAIALMHSHVRDEHERVVQELARQVGFVDISRSSEVAPLIKLASRAETTTLDAYLNPILTRYVSEVWDQFGGPTTCHFRLMTSAGNLVAPNAFRGRDSILSGPAGGVVALADVATAAGANHAIGFDMGGTSTDVSRFEGTVGRRQESVVAGVSVMTPMMDIETVAAGGGSICDYVDGRMTVGPASAGANPGPACYGRGGPLTVTDVNLLLGRIPADRFPFALDRDAAQQRLESIGLAMGRDGLGDNRSLAEGFLDIAVAHMSEAVRTVSTAQGSDVRDMALVGFGGAAGQHLCRVATALGMKRILDHHDAGMLSALGMGLANIGRVVTTGVYRLLHQIQPDALHKLAKQIAAEATEQLAAEGVGDREPHFRYECDVRYQGTDAALMVPLEPIDSIGTRFHQMHQDTFGYHQPDRSVEIVAVRCEATLASAVQESVDVQRAENAASIQPNQRVQFWHQGRMIDADQVDREGLRLGDVVVGPAMIVADHATLLVEPQWMARVIDHRMIELLPADRTPVDPATREQAEDEQVQDENGIARVSDPVSVEIVARRLQGIADAMGEVLRRTSISVNVKERRDYSCAVFRGDGLLIANAPHVPVHLGAMGHTVRHLMTAYPMMSPGDAWLSNDPMSGGSHLPDVTLVMPVFVDPDSEPGTPDYFVASRAHHAEIGGRTPGSMPPDAVSLAEEGVLIRDFALVRSGHSDVQGLRQLLSSGRYPSRSVDENLADIAAAQAACIHGVTALRELAGQHSIDQLNQWMQAILDLAGDAMNRWIETLNDEAMVFEDALDDGTPIGVMIRRVGDRLSIRFDPTPVHRFGFNATPAIVTAAVLYVLRCVAGTNLPLCEGVLRDVDLEIPAGMLNPPADDDPAKCPAVVAGNVETSQKIVDVLLGALGVAAASQGTMNNVIFGDDTFGYYETIGGGSGATANQDGADAVHTHMTNTRITDPEVVESRLPIRLWQFAIRRGSGGAGLHRGGDGIVREFEFLRPLTLSLLTGRRTTGPYGVAGGSPGAAGRNRLVHDGVDTVLPASITRPVSVGDRLIIETPGGGGWGSQSRPS
ncbi:Acetophenone carboxylase gamma subunit [Rubripirellula lacrimiformis]|uniref:Acetophenone carboxylase gamma subunit n=1 Tax=Rubripirellula lacrimiformis TaxID=1930273 RepID=A0A517N3J5_9BACT|nr:hydantoinase B/oxoprolinase family protein [Rubripirellula lacrimiformis]QDT01703.1 Acetophenone carboxylase gamma subunit [Rubripirellula lacrimiformis]